MTNRHKHTLIKADIPSSPSVFSLRCHQLHCSVQTEEQPRASDPGNVSLVVTPPVKGAGVVYTGSLILGLTVFLSQIHKYTQFCSWTIPNICIFPHLVCNSECRKKKMLRKMISLNFSKNVLDILSICFCSDDQICFNYLLVVFLLFSDSL